MGIGGRVGALRLACFRNVSTDGDFVVTAPTCRARSAGCCWARPRGLPPGEVAHAPGV
ncbi:MAG TPA: hypothetical protein VKF62_04605 [Planctomycetota bacterium]|nr:hypothetical protein [Planctomycetota bacterium]